MTHTLQLILLLLAASVVAVVLCRLVRLPPILGYLAIGIAVGPHALGWVPDDANVQAMYVLRRSTSSPSQHAHKL